MINKQPIDLSELITCPITRDIMTDPVIAPDGMTYERESITSWLEQHATSPITRQRMNCAALIPNRAIKNIIDKLARPQQPESKGQQPQESEGQQPTESEGQPESEGQQNRVLLAAPISPPVISQPVREVHEHRYRPSHDNINPPVREVHEHHHRPSHDNINPPVREVHEHRHRPYYGNIVQQQPNHHRRPIRNRDPFILENTNVATMSNFGRTNTSFDNLNYSNIDNTSINYLPEYTYATNDHAPINYHNFDYNIATTIRPNNYNNTSNNYFSKYAYAINNNNNDYISTRRYNCDHNATITQRR
jgi:hypothetical protein